MRERERKRERERERDRQRDKSVVKKNKAFSRLRYTVLQVQLPSLRFRNYRGCSY